MEKIVFLDRDTIGPSVTITRPSFEHHWSEFASTSPQQVVEHLSGATIAITNKVAIREDVLDQLPDLKMIAVAATGYDIIDIAACVERGITVSNVRGYAINTVPEHTFALILALRRSLMGFRQDVIDGKWQQSDQFCLFTHPVRDLSGAVLGIFGKGVLGEAVASLGRAFGMHPLFAARKGDDNPAPHRTPFEEVLQTADVITLHMPLTPQTRNIIAMPEFQKMKQKPLIINTARGGLVCEDDIAAALDEGLISGIGFDVISTEPPTDDNPLLKIAERPNVLITPHIAWSSAEAMRILWDQVIEHMENYHKGTPTNIVR